MDDKFRAIQDKLLAQNSDRKQHLSLSFVLSLYDEFSNELANANSVEVEQSKAVIDQTLIIFSLAFMTVGHTREPISTYAKIVTFRTLYEFISSDMYITPKELSLLEACLVNAQAAPEHVGEDTIKHIPYLDAQIWEDVKVIKVYNSHDARVMSLIPEEEYPLNSQIIHLRRDILAEVIKQDFRADRLQILIDKFDRIKSHLANIDWPISRFTRAQCYKAEQLITKFRNGVSEREVEQEEPSLVPIFHTLRDMLPELEVYVMTRRWTLRATDLYQQMNYLLSIMPKLLITHQNTRPIDEVSLAGSLEEHHTIGDVPGEEIDVEPAAKNPSKYLSLVTYMARRAWSQIYKLLESTEPVSEALSSYYNQLLTMKRCLNEVRLAGGISNLRELYPFQMKLSSLDNSREDGKFIVNDEVPPGQGVLNGILAECFDSVYELKVELEEKGEVDDEEEEEEDDTNSKVVDADDSPRNVKKSSSSSSSSSSDDDDPIIVQHTANKDMPSLDDSSTMNESL